MISLFLCSCGNLNQQQLGGDKLSANNIKFAQGMIIEPNWEPMCMTFNDQKNYTDCWNSRVMPVFPVIYWTTFGNFEADSCYGLKKVASFFPLFYLVRNSVYDSRGMRKTSTTDFNLALTMGYQDSRTSDSFEWKYGLLWIPGLGPFLGFGTGYFQFLWIPFSEM